MKKIKSIPNQKKVADFVLFCLEKIDPAAICAGGAPRDWAMKNIAKDLDFYFCPGVSVPPEYMISMLTSVGLVVGGDDYGFGFVEREELPEEYKKYPYLVRMITLSVDSEDVQIMEMSKPVEKSTIPTFPITLSMISYKNGKLSPTEEFLDAIVNREVKIVNNGYDNSERYIQKITSRFPNFTVVRGE
jgi:hypothetical protein